MKDLNEYFIPEIEWEFSNFPLTLINLEFEKTNWGFNEKSTIKIWKNKDSQLEGEVIGSVSDFSSTESENFIGKGNIIIGQSIIGFDENGNQVKISGAVLGQFSTNNYEFENNRNLSKGELIFDSLSIEFLKNEGVKKTKKLDWFVCDKIQARFTGSTIRQLTSEIVKIRKGIDKYDDKVENLIGSSTSRDFIFIKLKEFELIIAKVPDRFTPKNKDGICFEYRGTTKFDEKTFYSIKHLTSFFLGCELNHIGYSIVNENSLIKSFMRSAHPHNILNSMNPITFNFKYDWGNFHNLMNKYLPKYLEITEKLSIDDSISKLWVAKKSPIGTNLPILASALESIVSKYIKENEISLEYISKDEYNNLISNELNSIENKFSNIEGGEIMFNKISGVFRKGPSEKMLSFFDKAGINIGKTEKKAIKLRNKMAHSSSKYDKKSDIYNDLILSRVYEVLFNRVILKLLNYDGYYIDYSIQGCPNKHIDIPAGESLLPTPYIAHS